MGQAKILKQTLGADYGTPTETTTPDANCYYWVAINGSSVSASLLSLLPRPHRILPTPEMLIGFASRDEAQQAQKYLLTAPIDECQKRLLEYRKRADHGEIALYFFAYPERQTSDGTQWIFGK